MKHLMIADKSVLLGDEAADLLARYAAALADRSRADTVEVRAIDASGPTTLTVVLDAGTQLVIETTDTTFDEPDNRAMVDAVQERLSALDAQRHPDADAVSGAEVWNAPGVD